MAITKMVAIEYNMWMSIMKLIADTVKSSFTEYDGLNRIKDIPVLPAYPRNLSKFTKPSIIVQKVGTDNTPLCSNGFIGQYYDDSIGSYLDVFAVNYESTYQIDVSCDSNTERSLITALLTDELFNNKIRFENSGKVDIYNFASSLDDPQLMGYAKLDPIIDVRNLDRKYRPDNEYKLYNYDYATAIRFDISMIQVVIPENQDLIDLSKPIKVTQHVKLQ